MTFAGIDIVLIVRNIDETISIYARSLGKPKTAGRNSTRHEADSGTGPYLQRRDCGCQNYFLSPFGFNSINDFKMRHKIIKPAQDRSGSTTVCSASLPTLDRLRRTPKSKYAKFHVSVERMSQQ